MIFPMDEAMRTATDKTSNIPELKLIKDISVPFCVDKELKNNMINTISGTNIRKPICICYYYLKE